MVRVDNITQNQAFWISMKHWIFDFDGTLVNTDGLFNKTLGHALEPFDITVDEFFIEKIRHKHPDNIFEDFLDKEQARVALSRLAEAGREVAAEVRLFPGILSILETILDSGSTLSIWTGRDLYSTEMILKTQGVHDLFHKIVSGTCVKNNKPGHDGLIEIQQAKKAKFEEMVMIGDHHHDIEPARALGITSVHARWKSKPVTLPEKVKPNVQFGSTQKFHMWVKGQTS